MNPLPIRLRLTVWYSVVLAVVLSVFGLSAYFEMRNSIHETVDESLRDRVGGVRGLIERNSPFGRDEVRRELREHSELAGGALLQVSDQQGDLLYRSASMNDLEIPIASRSFTGPFTFVSQNIPLRLLNAGIKVGSQSYLVQVAAPLDDFYEALHRFGTLLLVSIPILLLCAAGGGYWMSQRVALMRTRAELSLRKPRSAEEYRDALTQVHSELVKISSLVEKLMLLARSDYGAETLQLATSNLAEIVREACDQGTTLAESKQIDFHKDIPKEPVWIDADPNALGRLFLILIDNAVKYTPPGGRVDVVVKGEGGSALGEVRDTGIGIAEEDLPHVFERFYRADKARSRESGGVGLGLSIGRWIAEAHAGTIEVQSSLGHGSVFQVRLPLANGRS